MHTPTTPDEPLGLTIQNLPGQNNPVPDALRIQRGRRMMLLLLLACVAPVLASYFTFYVIKPKGGNSYGSLIKTGPQTEIPNITAHDLNGQAVPLRSLRGQWVLLSVASAACPKSCQDHLYYQRQIREMLGREKDRLDWVWLINDSAALEPHLQAVAQQAHALRADPAQLAAWLAPAPGQALEDHLYLIDPMGNWMMRFPAQMDSKKVYRDINRLLRASNSWDQAGRD